MKNILLIGSEGIIGSSIQNILKNKYNFFCMDIRENSAISSDRYAEINFEFSNFTEKVIAFLEEIDIKFDGVVYLSGFNPQNNFFSIQLSEWEKTFDINVKGFLFTLKAAWPYLNPDASIIAMASQNGVVGHSNRIEYGPSKAALIQLVRNLTVDFANVKSNIRVNAISPSYIINDLNSKLLTGPLGKNLKERIPYKKFVEVKDVVNSVDFLLSDQSSSIRGQNLIIDNGYTVV